MPSSSDGSQWTKVYTGDAGLQSAAWQETFTEMLGRTIRTERPAYGGTILATEYEYNELGRIVRKGEKSFAPEDPENPTHMPATLYAYNELGEQTVQAVDLSGTLEIDYTADRVNKTETVYEEINGDFWHVTRSYVYPEDNGNMTQYGDWSFTWNGENRLVEVKDNGVTVVENTYDYMGRRISKTADGVTHEYLYDGWNLIRETIDDGAPQTDNHYVWGLDLSQSLQGAGGVGGLLLAVLDGDAYYPGFDANGNVTDYTSASGTTVAEYQYSPFGGITSQTGPMADDFVYRFSTKYTDDETGLV